MSHSYMYHCCACKPAETAFNGLPEEVSQEALGGGKGPRGRRKEKEEREEKRGAYE